MSSIGKKKTVNWYSQAKEWYGILSYWIAIIFNYLFVLDTHNCYGIALFHPFFGTKKYVYFNPIKTNKNCELYHYQKTTNSLEKTTNLLKKLPIPFFFLPIPCSVCRYFVWQLLPSVV